MVFGHHDMTIITKNNCAAQSGDSKLSALYPKCEIEMRRPHFSNASTLNVPNEGTSGLVDLSLNLEAER